jgi:hypothetical protein
LDTPASLPVETVSISRLFCSPTNPRRNDQAVPHVAASLRRFGWQQPIVARRTGEVIAGNTRLKAAQSLGMTEVPKASRLLGNRGQGDVVLQTSQIALKQ